MDAFLKKTKQKLASSTAADDTTVHAVLGNESCDLDSAVCALVWAFYLDKCKEREDTAVHIPVFNIPRKDYRLRTEVVHACNKLKLDEQDLTFKDEIDLSSWQQKDRLQLTLVDHNVLSVVDASLEGSVVEVIDHHQRDWPDTDSAVVTVEPVGSCCTLVAEKLLQDGNFEIDCDVAWLLSGPILVDTVCLSAAAGRTTAKDESIIQRLQQLLPEVDHRQLFEELQQVKMDVSDLSTMDVLRKDLKLVTSAGLTVAMSSVPMHMKELLGRADLQDDLTQFADGNNVDVIVVMSLDVDEAGTASRQLAVWSLDSTKQQQMVQCFQSTSDPGLDLQPLTCDLPNLRAFDQGNVKASRKKIMPLVKNCFEKNCFNMTTD